MLMSGCGVTSKTLVRTTHSVARAVATVASGWDFGAAVCDGSLVVAW